MFRRGSFLNESALNLLGLSLISLEKLTRKREMLIFIIACALLAGRTGLVDSLK
jgi:hypothetical protein